MIDKRNTVERTRLIKSFANTVSLEKNHKKFEHLLDEQVKFLSLNAFMLSQSKKDITISEKTILVASALGRGKSFGRSPLNSKKGVAARAKLNAVLMAIDAAPEVYDAQSS